MESLQSRSSLAFTTPAPLTSIATRGSGRAHGRSVGFPPALTVPRRRTLAIRNAVASPPPPTRPPARRDLSGPIPPASPCAQIIGRESLKRSISEASSNTPVIVFFHARWCRVCKTLASKLSKVAANYPQLIWYEVDFAVSENKPLCKELGVKLLPTFRLYWGGSDDTQYEENFTTGPFGSKRLEERLGEFFDANADKLMSS